MGRLGEEARGAYCCNCSSVDSVAICGPGSQKRQNRLFRVASKNVLSYTVEGNFRVSHSVDLHSNDGDEFTTETRCEVSVRARLVKKGRTISGGAFVHLLAPDNENTPIFYSLNRRGVRKPPAKRAKKLVVTHVHVDVASCYAAG
jgi:hypothetical protein